MRKIKLFNFRFYLVAAVFLATGILTAIYLSAENLPIVFLCVFAAGLLFLCIRGKRKFLIVFFVIGLVYVPLQMQVHSTRNVEPQNNVRIEGTIDSLTLEGGGDTVRFVITNVRVGGERYGGRTNVFIRSTVYNRHSGDIRQGNRITFYGDIHKYFLNPEHPRFFNKRIHYRADVDFIVDAAPTFAPAPWFRQRVFEILSANMQHERVGITYALLFGDSSYIVGDVQHDYRESGVAHLFAVSGLHIGFLYGLLLILTKKLKLRTRNILLAIIFFAYAYLCGFSPPILRACIMIGVNILARSLNKKLDSLNSLFFASTIILLINPLFILSVSFLMSFCTVFGIILFANRIRNFLYRIWGGIKQKFTRKSAGQAKGKTVDHPQDAFCVSQNLDDMGNKQGGGVGQPQKAFSRNNLAINSFTMTASANIGAFVIVSTFLGGMPVITFIANLVVVPIVTWVFPYALIFAALGSALPFFGWFYRLIDLVISFINSFVGLTGQVGTVLIVGFNVFTAILYFVILLYFSKFYLGPRLYLFRRLKAKFAKK